MNIPYAILAIMLGLLGPSTGDFLRVKRQFPNPSSTIASFVDSKQSSLAKTNIASQLFDSIVERFQVNKNSIIRTHDSRALGAKYLNESDLSSNEDCLRWCWNTSNCNMAVFEEKTRGSCYLFDCGSLEDFKCRFTPHSFYTSSVLQVNRNSYFLNEWKTQANQENELSGLKQEQLQKPSALSKASSVKSIPVAKISRCRHYQFECRNNSECIAIYNVCDGIPQCADGSDEAFELECHKSRLHKQSVDSEQPDKGKTIDYYKLSGTQKFPLLSSQSSVSSSSISKTVDSLEPQQPQSKILNYPSNYLAYNYPRTPNGGKLEEESLLYSNRAAAAASNTQLNNEYNYGLPSAWNQYNLQNEIKGDKTSTGFEPEQQQQPFNTGLKESIYWPSFSVEGHARPQVDIPYNLPPSIGEIPRNRPLDYIQQRQPQYQLANQFFKPNTTTTNVEQKTTVKPTSKPKTEYSNISSDEKKVPMKSPSIVAISYMHDTSPQNGRDTNSAVIALTLGLFITTILIVIVGCRMKSFKKRIARRGRSLAHDSDYLVNGMYL